MIRRAIVFYLGLTALGLILSVSFNIQPILFFPLKETAPHFAFQFAFGIGVGLLVVLINSRVAQTNHGKQFEDLLKDTFAGLSWMDGITLALLSSLAEEWLFRSILLVWMGVLPSSVLFALLHIPPKRALIFWPVMAFILGWGFATWTQYSDSVLGATLAHFIINAWTLTQMFKKNNQTQNRSP